MGSGAASAAGSEGIVVLRQTVRAWGLALALCVAAPRASGQQIIYVDSSATGGETGVCWDDAYIDLQDALSEMLRARKSVWRG